MSNDKADKEQRALMVLTNVVDIHGGPIQIPDKANPAIPDHIWTQLQNLGELAVNRLEALVTDPRFVKFSVKEQMRVIETILARAYGSPDGSVRRNLHMHIRPEDNKGYNTMTEMAGRARNLPEFRRPSIRVKAPSEDAEPNDLPVWRKHTFNTETAEDIPGDGD